MVSWVFIWVFQVKNGKHVKLNILQLHVFVHVFSFFSSLSWIKHPPNPQKVWPPKSEPGYEETTGSAGLEMMFFGYHMDGAMTMAKGIQRFQQKLSKVTTLGLNMSWNKAKTLA